MFWHVFTRRNLFILVLVFIIVYLFLFSKFKWIQKTSVHMSNNTATFRQLLQKVESHTKSIDPLTTNPYRNSSRLKVYHANYKSGRRELDSNIRLTNVSTYSERHVENVTFFVKSRLSILSNVSCLDKHVTLVICVPSSRNNFAARKAIRESWGSYAAIATNKAVLIFAVGQDGNVDLASRMSSQTALEREVEQYGDILVVENIDSYRNLTLKTLSILRWVVTHCPNSQFLLKADDDMFINVPLLVKVLWQTLEYNTEFIIGKSVINAQPWRDPSSKWYASYNDYSGYRYPQFVCGPAYAMTTRAAKKLYAASFSVPLFHLEDVYLTGLCARKSGVKVMNNGRFHNDRLPGGVCDFQDNVAAHEYSPEEMLRMFQVLNDRLPGCS